MSAGPVGFDVEQQALIWAMWRRGDAIREMERTLGETLPQPTGARAGAHARSTTLMPLRPASSGRRASQPPISRKCWGSPAPPCTGMSPTMLLRESAGLA